MNEFVEDLCELEQIFVSLIGLNLAFMVLLLISLVGIESGSDSYYAVLLGAFVCTLGITVGAVFLFGCRHTTVGR